ncbi:MAG: DUF87 domain-containing protein [archaeon]
MAKDAQEAPSIIGRSLYDIEKYGEEATAYIGKVVMSTGQHPVLGRKVLCDVAKPHVVLICGKRGAGKSYSMAVFIEEFARQPFAIKKRLAAIVIDTVGIFWTLKIKNKFEEKELQEWDLKPQETNVRVLVPKGRYDFYKEKEIPVDDAFTIKTSELEELEWMALFKLTWKDAEGVLLTNAIGEVKEKLGTLYGIKEIISAIKNADAAEETKRALVNRFKVAETWGLFEKEGTKLKDFAKPGSITIIDVSAYRQAVGMEGARDIIVGLLGKKLFEERMLYRKEEEVRLTQGLPRESEMPIVWLMVDEAHMFMPNDEYSLALNTLL